MGEVDKFMKTSWAFPSHMDFGEAGVAYHSGMTLRDYFAAKAMHALLSDRMPRSVDERELICNLAYAVARGMLAAREAK